MDQLKQEPVLQDFLIQGSAIEGLLQTLEEGTYVHAYLISGIRGVGKRSLAKEIARYLLCTGDNPPCGACAACQQVREGTHPDMIWVKPGYRAGSDQETERGKNAIVVETVRELIGLISAKAYEGKNRIAIIEQAELMNPAAQNALLKTLEEPPEKVVFLLLTETPGALLPTIISRCRQVSLHPWENKVVLRILRGLGYQDDRIVLAVHAAGGSIGKAISIVGDESFFGRRQKIMDQFFGLPDRSSIYSIANEWKDAKDQSLTLLDDLEDMVHSLFLCHLGMADESICSAYPAQWQNMARNGGTENFLHLISSIQEARAKKISQVTWSAVLERLLLDFMEEKMKWSV